MNYAVILAGGSGMRAGGPLPKQFQILRGRRMLWWSALAFRSFDPLCRIILVVRPDFLSRWDELFGAEEEALGLSLVKVPGGESRIRSVINGLKAVDDPEAVVFIHDAARPFVTPEVIARGVASVSSGVGAVPVVPLSDSIRRIFPGGSQAVDRASYAAVQTPQVFLLSDILPAYMSLTDESGLTDDASVAERAGLRIATFPGDPANLKITNPSDFCR